MKYHLKKFLLFMGLIATFSFGLNCILAGLFIYDSLRVPLVSTGLIALVIDVVYYFLVFRKFYPYD